MTPIDPSVGQTQVKSYIDAHYHDASPIYSFSLDANMLRSYLNSTTANAKGQTGTQVTNLKLIFSNDLTDPANPTLSLVVIGYDDSGTYILNENNLLYDRVAACPVMCPPIGQAACSYLKLNDTDPCNP